MSTYSATQSKPTTPTNGSAPPDTLEELLADVVGQQQTLASQIKQDKTTLGNNEALQQKLGKQVTDLEKSLKGLDQARKDAEAASAAAGNAIEAAHDLICELEDDVVKGIETDIAAIDEDIRTKREAVKDKSGELKTLKNELVGLQQALDDHQATYDAALGSLTGLSTALTGLIATMAKTKAELENAVAAGQERRAFVLVTELTAQREQLDRWRSDGYEAELVEKFLAARTALNEAREARDAKQAEVIAAEAELALRTTERDAAIKGRPDKIKELFVAKTDDKPAASEDAEGA